MPKPLSIDLRERVLAAVAGGMSRRAAAERFGVAPSTAIKWVATWRANGRDRPLTAGGDLARERPRPSPHRGRRPTFASDRDPRRGDSGVAGGDPRCHAGRSDGRPCASAWPPGPRTVAILCASGHHVQEEDRARLRAGTPRCGTAPTGVAGWPTRSSFVDETGTSQDGTAARARPARGTLPGTGPARALADDDVRWSPAGGRDDGAHGAGRPPWPNLPDLGQLRTPARCVVVPSPGRRRAGGRRRTAPIEPHPSSSRPASRGSPPAPSRPSGTPSPPRWRRSPPANVETTSGQQAMTVPEQAMTVPEQAMTVPERNTL